MSDARNLTEAVREFAADLKRLGHGDGSPREVLQELLLAIRVAQRARVRILAEHDKPSAQG